MTSRVWVVEMLERGRWRPCAGAPLTKRDANREKRDYWEYNNPNDRFRVRKYVPQEAKS